MKHRTLNGLDDIGLTLQHADDIEKFEDGRPSLKPDTARAFTDTLKIG